MNAQQEFTRIAVIGSGTLGSQIAFTMAALGGHRVSLFDNNPSAIEFAKAQMSNWLSAVVHESGRCSTESEFNELLTAADSLVWRFIFESPTGPCEMMDQIGLDTVLAIERLYATESGSKSDQPPEFLERWVNNGRLGKKTGHGFFSYGPL